MDGVKTIIQEKKNRSSKDTSLEETILRGRREAVPLRGGGKAVGLEISAGKERNAMDSAFIFGGRSLMATPRPPRLALCGGPGDEVGPRGSLVFRCKPTRRPW